MEARVEIIDLTLLRIKDLLNTNLTHLTPVELVRKGLCDCMRLFIKNEPHGAKKIDSKRWRLISCLSVVDQIIDRVLHTGQNKLEIKLHTYIPSCSGLGLDTSKDIVAFRKKVITFSKGGPIASADVTGFDWSVQEWELLFDTECRIALAHAEGTAFATLARARVTCICRAILVVDDGTMYAQKPKHYGIQKSGTYNTASSNSRIRTILAWLVGAMWAIAMGDDSLEDPVEGATEKYARLGHPLKMYNIQGETYEFCSHFFERDAVFPSNPSKSLFRLLSKPVIDGDAINMITHFMRSHPGINLLMCRLAYDKRVDASGLEAIEVWQEHYGKKTKENEVPAQA